MPRPVAPAPVLLLRLPTLVAGRGLADKMLDRLSPSYEGTSVVVDAMLTSSGSTSFASQLVVHVLAEGRATTLVVAGAPDQFNHYCTSAAERLGVTDRLVIAPTMRAESVRTLVGNHA